MENHFFAIPDNLVTIKMEYDTVEHVETAEQFLDKAENVVNVSVNEKKITKDAGKERASLIKKGVKKVERRNVNRKVCKKCGGSYPKAEVNSSLYCKKCLPTNIQHIMAGFKNRIRKPPPDNSGMPLICNYCELGFSELSVFQYHLKSHTGAVPYCCGLCNETFVEEATLKLHLQGHPEENPPCVCGQCGRIFAYVGFLKQHLRSHSSGEPPNTCPICERRFFSQTSFETHIVKAHSGTTSSHICTYCGKAFQYNCHLQTHLRVHTRDKPYLCTECPARFPLPGSLKRHIQMYHTNEKAYHCVHCTASFLTPVKLNNHIKSHTKVSSYVCAECGSRYATLRGLREHRRRHASREKRYQCAHCSKAYHLRHSIIGHVARHLPPSAKTYACQKCEMRFFWPEGLKSHMRIHSGVRAFRCELCPKSYFTSATLKSHHVKTHPR